MKNVLAVLQVILALLAMLGVLLQTPKASGLGGTIGGGGDVGGGYRRRRGIEQRLFRLTWGFAAGFVLISVAYVYANR